MNMPPSEASISRIMPAVGFAIIELAKERERRIQLRGKDHMKYLRLIQEWRSSTSSTPVEVVLNPHQAEPAPIAYEIDFGFALDGGERQNFRSLGWLPLV